MNDAHGSPASGDRVAFLIIGGGFNNKGAEAMVLTVVEQLRMRWPLARVTVSSYAGSADATPARDEGRDRFEYVRHSRGWSFPPRVFLLGFSLSPAAKERIAGDDRHLRALGTTDVVIDISGFAFSAQRSLMRRFVYCFEIWASRWLGVPFVAMTQAFGPFSAVTRLLARASLPLAHLVVARGNDSARHLREAGVREFVQCADMAYLFRGETSDEGLRVLGEHGVPPGVPTFGIVPNINLYRQAGGQGRDNTYVQGLGRLAALARELGAWPVFVCHEGYRDRQDDEWLARQAIELSGVERSAVIPATYTAARLKGVIAALSFVVACRFHSLVAAISTATPFLALGWSHKYHELVEEAGEGSAWIDGRFTTPPEWCQRATDLWSQRNAMRARLGDVTPRLEASARLAFDVLAQRLGPAASTGVSAPPRPTPSDLPSAT